MPTPIVQIRSLSKSYRRDSLEIPVLRDIPPNVGYSVVFALLAVETMGIPVPGETALIAAALLAHDGKMDIVTLIVLLVGEVVLSATGLSSDPHGYGVFAGILFAAVLTPVALALWLLYRSMRRRGT